MVVFSSVKVQLTAIASDKGAVKQIRLVLQKGSLVCRSRYGIMIGSTESNPLYIESSLLGATVSIFGAISQLSLMNSNKHLQIEIRGH